MSTYAERAQLRLGGTKRFRSEVVEPLEMAQNFARSLTGQESLQGAGLTFAERAKISFYGDTPDEKKATFENMFPKGEYVPVPNTDQTIFRRNRQEPFRLADPSISQALREGRLTEETIQDLADIAGDLPEIAGETAAMLIGKGKGGKAVEVGKGVFQASRTIAADMVRLFGGGAGGSQAQQAAQSLAGTQRQTVEEQLEQSAGEGMLSLVGGTIGDVIGRGINVARGAGVMSRTPEGVIAQESAERMGMSQSLPVATTTDNPMIRLLARQSGSLTSAIGRELREFNTKLVEMVQKGVKPGELKRFTKRGHAVLREQNSKLLRHVNKALGNPDISLNEAAPFVKSAVEEWWNVTSKKHVDNLYDTARSIESPRFDIEGLKRQAQEITSRPTASGPTQTTRSPYQGQGQERPFFITKTSQTSIAAGEVNPAVEQVVAKLAKLDPKEPVTLEFLRGLRQEIYDASLPGPNGERLLDAKGRALQLEINKTIKNVQNTNPDFVGAWNAADKAAHDRFTTRELVAVSELIKTDRPAIALQKIVQPGNFEAIAELSRAMAPSQFKVLGKAFEFELLMDPTNAAKTLDTFKPETRRLLLSEPHEKAIREYSEKVNRLDKTKLGVALEQQATIRGQVREIINNPQTRGIEDFRKLVKERGKPFQKSVRAAIMDEVIAQARDVTKAGAEVINSSQLRGVVKKFKDSGVWNLLTLQDQMFLQDASKVANVLGTAADAGTALRAASAVSGLVELSGAAFSELIESMSVGRILTSEGGKKFLAGTARGTPFDLTNIRLMGGIVATISGDVEEE